MVEIAVFAQPGPVASHVSVPSVAPMAMPALLNSTGDGRCDKIVQGLLGAFEVAFGGRVHSCYLRGSRASGSSVDGSDLDLYVVFKDRFIDVDEFERARLLCGCCARMSPVLLEVVLIGERRLHDSDALDAALDLQLGTRLLFGDDFRAGLPGFDATRYVRNVVHTPYYSYSMPEQRGKRLICPLRHIDPTGEFYGFDQWLVPGRDGADVPSTKLLVATVGWTATATVAMRTGTYVRDKTASVRLYLEHVGDEWASLVADVQHLCRDGWHYLLPTGSADRRVLRELCVRALDFQNHYLRFYLEYQLSELASGDAERQLLAVRRLDQIVFPDKTVIDALHELRKTNDVPLRSEVASTLTTYEKLHRRAEPGS